MALAPTENLIKVDKDTPTAVIQAAFKGEIGQAFAATRHDEGYTYDFIARRTGEDTIWLWQDSNAPGYHDDDDDGLDGFEVDRMEFAQRMGFFMAMGSEQSLVEDGLDMDWLEAQFIDEDEVA